MFAKFVLTPGDLFTNQLIRKMNIINNASDIKILFNLRAGNLAVVHNTTTSIKILAKAKTLTFKKVRTIKIIAQTILIVGLNLFKKVGLLSNEETKLIRYRLS
ncbi:MAG: hypothetical protein MJ223_03295 [Mycoplasmoidaceae bacterium]|nr:hypothetical protein [Mycoplasmoidaceae bacterium]